MAKRWRNMSETERSAVLDSHVTRIGDMIETFTRDHDMWRAFESYAMSSGRYLSAANTVDAFAQHHAHDVAKVSDLRTWSEWIKAGRTPRNGRKVSVFTTFPLHLWDVADTDVTDRAAWRKASPAQPAEGGADIVAEVVEIARRSFNVDVTAPEPTPAERERARLRAEGYKGSLDVMMRAEWRAETDRLHDVCEAAISGAWLNARGESKVKSTRAMFVNDKQARAYGSPELMSWYASNGGVPTFAQYRARLFGEAAPRQSFADVNGG